MTHVLVADPVPIFRAGVRATLAGEPDVTVGDACSLAGLLQAAERTRPDAVLVDAGLPPAGAVEAIEAVGERIGAPVALWSLAPTPAAVVAAIRAGASGCVPKEIGPEGLVRCVRALAAGEAVVPRPLQAAVLDALRRDGRRERARVRAEQLTYREREVLALVARGARNRQIAEELEISEFTVKRHVQKILQKLQVASRVAAASFYEDALLPARSAR